MKRMPEPSFSPYLITGMLTLVILMLAGACTTNRPPASDESTNKLPEREEYLFQIEGGEVILLYKLQKEIAQSGLDALSMRAVLADTVYPLNEKLFSYCLGYTQASFSEKYTAAMLYKADSLLKIARTHEMLKLDSVIITTMKAIADESIIPFEGRYTIGFFEDVGCMMCGCDNYTMLGNTYNEVYNKPERLKVLLAHEINHNFYETSRQDDPDKSTVLYKAIDEGFANFFSMKAMHATRLSAFNMSEEEYRWLQDHEAALKEAFAKVMFSTEEEDWDPYSERIPNRIIEGSPGDIGYFIGFRIIEEWLLQDKGRNWQDVYSTPVRKILAESNYFE